MLALPKSCGEIKQIIGWTKKHKIYPNGDVESGVEVLCDFETEDGGWTIIQKRSSGPKGEFSRTWAEYERGFGSIDKNYWIGLSRIRDLTKDGDQELRIDLWDFDFDRAYAKYSIFSIADSNYQLSIRDYSGTAGDSMTGDVNLNQRRFSTKDKDNGHHSIFNCADYLSGAWWHQSCSRSNLNGLYYEQGETPDAFASGIYWYTWKNSWRSLRQVEMKIRKSL